jgi:hypothetical protein
MKQIFMVPGQYYLLFVSMNEECRSFLCSKEDHTLQYVVLSNEVGLSPFLLHPGSLTFSCSLKIKALCIWIINLMLLILLLFSDPEISVTTSSLVSKIFSLSMSRRDRASVTIFFFPGRYSNVTPYYSSSKIQHVRKTRSEAFKPLEVLFLWSVKTMMG